MKESAENVKIKSRGITLRWIMGSLLWLVVLLVIAETALYVSVRENYYNSAKQALEFRVRLTVSSIPTSPLLSKDERMDYVASLVENFDEKNRFELMLVNFSGVPVMTSSGFPFRGTEELNSLSATLESADGMSSYIGQSGSGEKVVCVTQLLTVPAGDVYAVRIVSSLKTVDNEISKMAQLFVIVGLLVLGFSIYSGSYFIRSIVLPIRRVSAGAAKIANGDFSVRVESRYNDEIGGLCEQINEMAEGLSETDRVKNEFISSVSHELRTPLTSIKGWAQTLATIGPDDRETFNKGIRIMNRETERLSDMVEDLLDFSRMSRGGFKMNNEPIDLIAELSDTVITVEERAKRHDIELCFNEDQQPAIVVADRNRIKQVFVNILDNAIKYTPAGGRIDVFTTRDEHVITAVVNDTGAGIAPEDIPRITQRFFKGANAVRGSGIGLAVVEEIVTALGGTLAVSSELGKGTSVNVTLPLKLKEKIKEEK